MPFFMRVFQYFLQIALQVYDFPCGNINLRNQSDKQTFLTY